MELTPVQQRTLDELMRMQPLPVFPRELVEGLRADLEHRLRPLTDNLRDGEGVWLSKSKLSDLHGRCEGLFLANHLGEGEFELGWQLARGALVHRAIAVSVNLPDRSDAELVEAALAQLRRDDAAFDEFCLGLSDPDLAALESEAVEMVLLFRVTFPPLQKAWSPAVEPSLKATFGDRVVLSARPDLLLGSDDREEPMRARRLVIELKTGTDRPEHDDDLRFYALLATLRLGVPPFRVATVFLDDGTWRAHDVSEDLLEAAVRRIGDGAVRAGAIIAGQEEPRLRPGPWCRWCPRTETCPESAFRADD